MIEPEFLEVKPEDIVLFGEDEIAKVISFVGVRDPDDCTFLNRKFRFR